MRPSGQEDLSPDPTSLAVAFSSELSDAFVLSAGVRIRERLGFARHHWTSNGNEGSRRSCRVIASCGPDLVDKTG